MLEKTNRINWSAHEFGELSTNALYQILHLRSKIFVVEQSDIYLDVDNKDQQAIHIVGSVEGEIVAYCRAFRKGTCLEDSASIGRVLVDQGYREYGFGKELIRYTIELLGQENSITISAQLYLQKFYEDFGFEVKGHPYFDGSVEHIEMYKTNEK